MAANGKGKREKKGGGDGEADESRERLTEDGIEESFKR